MIHYKVDIISITITTITTTTITTTTITTLTTLITLTIITTIITITINIGNHQTELSDALAEQEYCISTCPSLLISTLSNVYNQGIDLKAFPSTDYTLFPKLVDSLYGFE